VNLVKVYPWREPRTGVRFLHRELRRGANLAFKRNRVRTFVPGNQDVLRVDTPGNERSSSRTKQRGTHRHDFTARLKARRKLGQVRRFKRNLML
jgi:hypothetical protein